MRMLPRRDGALIKLRPGRGSAATLQHTAGDARTGVAGRIGAIVVGACMDHHGCAIRIEDFFERPFRRVADIEGGAGAARGANLQIRHITQMGAAWRQAPMIAIIGVEMATQPL